MTPKEAQTEWDGKDRRAPEGVLIAIMNHVQESLDKHRSEIDKRFDSLFLSINSYMEKQAKIEEAFLKNEHGHPDFDGHFYDHNNRKNLYLFWKKIKHHTIEKAFEWGTILLLGWIGMTIWTEFVRNVAAK